MTVHEGFVEGQANSVDQDQTAPKKQSELGLHSLETVYLNIL